MSIKFLRKVQSYISHYGIKTLIRKAIERGDDRSSYDVVDDKEKERQRNDKFNYEPVISIILPAYNTASDMLRETLLSVKNQTYSKWELCISDGGDVSVEEVVKEVFSYDERVIYKKSTEKLGLAKNSNAAIEMYAEEMTRVVLVPTWDESGKYYMGRTKVGIDELSVMATNYSDYVAEGEKQIMDNNLVIEKMSSVTASDLAKAQADEMIIAIDKAIDEFAIEAISAGREYSNYRMNQCIAVSISGSSLLSELKSVAVFAVISYVAVLLYTISKKFPKKA